MRTTLVFGLLILTSLNVMAQPAWTEWQTLPDGRSNLIEISYRIESFDYDGSSKYLYRVRNKYSSEARVTIEIEVMEGTKKSIRSWSWTLQPNSIDEYSGNYDIVSRILSFKVKELEVDAKLGDFQKDLIFPDALSGHWLLFNNAIKSCYNTSINESAPCPPGECQRIFISDKGDGTVIIEYINKSKTTFTREGNTLTAPSNGKFTFSISNNVLTMTADIAKRGPGCKFEWKYKRDD